MSSRTHRVMVIGIGSLRFLVTINWRLQVQSWLQANNNTGILSTCTWNQSKQSPLNKSLKFFVDSWVWQETPGEGWRTYWPKHCEYNNKDEDNNQKTLNDPHPQKTALHKLKNEPTTTNLINLKTIHSKNTQIDYSPVSWSCRIHWLHVCSGSTW